MKSYSILVYTYAPYKREYRYRTNASNVAAATSRAMRLFKREDKIKRRRLGKICLEVVGGL